MKYALAYDIGTTGVKTCLFEIDKSIRLVADAIEGYELYVLPGGGAEQDPDEWWAAMCKTTKELFKKTDITPDMVDGISFCSQAQGLVLVDKEGRHVRRAMSYMDQRAREELKELMAYGPQIAGANIPKLLVSLQKTGAVAASVKDPVYKYNWVRKNEPEVFARVHKWLDVKEALIARMTGEFVMTEDSAFGTLLLDIKKKCWSDPIVKMLNVDKNHLAKIIKCTDKAGEVTVKAAEELGLKPGTAVYGGGMDASLIGVGAGATKNGDTHVYMGTSGWVSTVVDKSIVDASAMIAAIVGAQPGLYNYFAELETAGKCLEWVRDHLCLDEIGIFKEKLDVAEDPETEYTSLYEYMTEVISKVPAGAGGVIFTPWLHGNRCPFEDPNAAGMFFNISIDTGKSQMLRAVIEGVCFHLNWMLEAQDKKIKTSDTIRFVGGGALSDVTCQILADITGKTVETVNRPQDIGAVGAAAMVAIGLGVIENVAKVKDFVPAIKTFKPNKENRAVYDKNFAVFKTLYKNNKDSFKALNG